MRSILIAYGFIILNWVDVVYNSIVGTTIMFESFTSAILGEPLAPIGKFFNTLSGTLLEGCEVLCNVTVRHADVEASLDFHVFEVLEFDILIGHPIEKLLDVSPQPQHQNRERFLFRPDLMSQEYNDKISSR